MNRSRRFFIFGRAALILSIALGLAAWRWRAFLSWPPLRPVIARPYAAWVNSSAMPERPAFPLPELKATVPSNLYLKPTFGDAINQLRATTDANLFVNWAALTPVKRDTPISINVGGKTLGEALSDLLESAEPTHRALGFSIDDGGIMISSKSDFAGNVCTRVYDVRDLMTGFVRSDYDKRLAEITANLELAIVDFPKPLKQERRHIRELAGQLIVTGTADEQNVTSYELQVERWKRYLKEFIGLSIYWIAPAAGIAFAIELVIYLHRRPTPPNKCRKCGYDIRASTGRCSECGEPIGTVMDHPSNAELKGW